MKRHALLSDGKTVALVTPDARITWMCHPRPDSAPLFAELVAGQAGGALSVRPAHEGAPTAQRYVEGTLTLETRWAGLIVSDYLDRGDPYGRSGGRMPRSQGAAAVRWPDRRRDGSERQARGRVCSNTERGEATGRLHAVAGRHARRPPRLRRPHARRVAAARQVLRAVLLRSRHRLRYPVLSPHPLRGRHRDRAPQAHRPSHARSSVRGESRQSGPARRVSAARAAARRATPASLACS